MLPLVGALVAGVLTTLAPCVLPVLPVVVGGSVASATRTRALVVTASLGLSVVAFTLLLKVSTALIGVDPQVWNVVAGSLLIALGLAGLFPATWDRVSISLGLQRRSAERLATARGREGFAGSVLTGAALGPVFTSCSPMYGYVVVTVLPSRPAYGLLLLALYVVGLCATLLAIALLGRRVLSRAGVLADPHGWLRRSLGAVFLVVGVLVLTGLDRDLQTWLVANSPLRPWDLDAGFIPDR